MSDNKNEKKIFCLMGPTAAGKTLLAVELAKRLPFDIISVDSAMIYRGMDIGTAKPTALELKITPHHLIDIRDPSETYSAGKFYQDAMTKIEEIFAKGRIPLLVGGTMLYFHALQHGISNLPHADERVRAKIKADKDKFGIEALYHQLQKIDPETATKVSKTDSQRIQRALEVHMITGKSISELKLISPPQALPYPIVNIVVAPLDISNLRCRIKERFEKMLQLGFIEEVQQLYQRGDLNPDLPSMRTVGYRQVWQYLSGQIDYEQMLELIPIATNQLAKRQLTWLRTWKEAIWFDSNSAELTSVVLNAIKF